MPNLSISSENVCFLIVKAREFDVQDVDTDPDSGSNATDDRMIDVLEESARQSGRAGDSASSSPSWARRRRPT